MLKITIAIIFSYLIGSIPTAYIFGRVLKGVDIRKFGSGNVGATNALRVLGKRAGIAVLLLDAFKGFLVVMIASKFFPAEFLWVTLGLICVIGHIWTVFLNFKGGKGMATTLGVLVGLSVKIPGLQIVLGCVLLVWLITFIFLRIVSLASILSAVALPILMVLFSQSAVMAVLSFILSLLVVLRHKANIVRLFQGKEPRLNFRKTNQ